MLAVRACDPDVLTDFRGGVVICCWVNETEAELTSVAAYSVVGEEAVQFGLGKEETA